MQRFVSHKRNELSTLYGKCALSCKHELNIELFITSRKIIQTKHLKNPWINIDRKRWIQKERCRWGIFHFRAMNFLHHFKVSNEMYEMLSNRFSIFSLRENRPSNLKHLECLFSEIGVFVLFWSGIMKKYCNATTSIFWSATATLSNLLCIYALWFFLASRFR